MLSSFSWKPRNLRDDLLAGLTTSFALVPEVVAFAFVAGVSPIIGLYSAFFLALLAAVVGGRPGMISGAAGATAIVSASLVASHGIHYLFPTVVLWGLIELIVGVAKLGKFIRMVPQSVMLGFVNGLAVVIALAQLGSFKIVSPSGHLTFLAGPSLLITLALVGLTMATIALLPRFTKKIPPALVAILITTLAATAINRFPPAALAGPDQPHVVTTIGDMLKINTKAKAVATAEKSGGEVDPAAIMAEVERNSTGISAGLPKLALSAFPPIDFNLLKIILPYAFILAGVGLVESLLTLQLVDELTETRGSANRECIGQGVANIACGLFGGMGGCAMIGQSLINVNSGGRGRTSGITAALAILCFILFLSRWVEMIPMAALVGVMFMVVIATFEWSTFQLWRKVPASDFAIMLLVAGYTIFMHDLATAVLLGVIASALVFAWRHAKHMSADVQLHGETKFYQLHGPLFFASVASFKELFTPATDPADVVIDFYYTRVYDQSALEAINGLADRYRQLGKRLHLRHLSPECRALLDRAEDLVEVNIAEDPHYHVATDRNLIGAQQIR